MGKKTKMKKQIPSDKAQEYQNFMIDVLCQYKSFKPEETVYLTEDDFHKAYGYVMNIQKMMDPEMLKQMKKQMNLEDEDLINPGTAQSAVDKLKDEFDME